MFFEETNILLKRKVKYLIQVYEFPEVASDMTRSTNRWIYGIKEYVLVFYKSAKPKRTTQGAQ